jgi:hypothetical protein
VAGGEAAATLVSERENILGLLMVDFTPLGFDVRIVTFVVTLYGH